MQMFYLRSSVNHSLPNSGGKNQIVKDWVDNKLEKVVSSDNFFKNFSCKSMQYKWDYS